MTDELFREVSEDLQRERYLRLWQRYGKFVTGGAVAIVVLTAAWVAWREYDLQQRQAYSDRFVSAVAMATEGNRDAAVNALGTLATEASGGYAVLAQLKQADLLANAGDRQGAAAIYDRVAADSGAPQALRDIATVLWALNAVGDADFATLESRLAPLAPETSPWHFTIRELLALAALDAGDHDRAQQMLRDLADDLTAPNGVRARATEMLAAIQA